jgi:hypothetical protein
MISGVLREEPIPIIVGVPTAPNDTGVQLAISATITAARAGKPSDKSNGAARAAGVPNPAAPSINPPNSHAIMIACILLSGEIFTKPLFIALRTPASLRVKRTVRAPKTIRRIFKAMIIPSIQEAKIQLTGVCQISRIRIIVMSNARGIALVAGQRKPTMKTNMAAIGITANKASRPVDIIAILKCYLVGLDFTDSGYNIYACKNYPCGII